MKSKKTITLLFIFLFCCAHALAANPLHKAISKNAISKAEQLIQNPTYTRFLKKCKIDLNEKNENGLTPLIRTVSLGHRSLTESLLRQKVDLEAVDFYGNTALFRAIEKKDLETIELLVQAGADLNAQNLGGVTAIGKAILTKDRLVFQKLIESADLRFEDFNRNNLLHLAAQSGDPETVRSLLDKGIPSDRGNRTGHTPFMTAVGSGNLEAALVLYAFEDSYTQRNIWGESAGQIASFRKLNKFLDELMLVWNNSPVSERDLFFYLEYDPSPEHPGWALVSSRFQEVVQLPGNSSEVLVKLKQAIGQNKIQICHRQLNELNLKIREIRFQELISIAEQNELDTDPQKKPILSISAQEEKIQTRCPICLEDLDSSWRPNSGPADCNCQVHFDCCNAIAENALANSGVELARCPLGCRGKLTVGFFKRCGFSESDISEFSKRSLAFRLASCPDWKFCTTSECVNGKIRKKLHTAQFKCEMCDKHQCLDCGQDHLGNCAGFKMAIAEMAELLKQGAKAGGRFRPCYFCGTITERADGCSAMVCANPACRKAWDWNSGEPGPHSLARARMNYKPLAQPHF